MTGKRAPLQIRFFDKVEKKEGCWCWHANKTKYGYGLIKKANSKAQLLAHRASWEIHFGAIPIGLQVLHRCDNRECTNPSHLFLGTNADNVADKVIKNRQSRVGRKKHTTSEQEREITKAFLDCGNIAEVVRRLGITRMVVRRVLGKMGRS